MNTTQIKDFAQFARDYNWEDTQPTIEDPVYAAEQICNLLVVDGNLDQGDCDELRVELVESAQLENLRREARAADAARRQIRAHLMP